MKTTTLATLLALALSSFAFADEKKKDDHDHDHEHIIAGPTGGRMITEVEPHAEFFVNADNKIEIRFFNHDNELVAPAGQTVSVIMGERSKPTKLAFAQEGDKLISDQAIPDGNLLPTVVQIKVGADAKTVTERFNLNLSVCPTCEYKEYACICDHEHEHDHDHGNEKAKEKKK
ncbi:MAG: hypothetical protein JNJ70_09220 [Verrucomicrobiales bacterium]|nr:hypothetical protein [Verrucomicrobiales bacterium]